MGQLGPGRARPSSQVLTVPKTIPKGICSIQVPQELALGQAVLEESWSALCRWPPMADPGVPSSCRVVSASIYCSLAENLRWTHVTAFASHKCPMTWLITPSIDAKPADPDRRNLPRHTL